MKRHPMQPIEIDGKGTARFKRNAIVEYLLDNGGLDMNDLAVVDFSEEDRRQFAMLIGYSVSGFGSLSYVDDVTYETAVTLMNTSQTEVEARIAHLEELITFLRKGLREPMSRLFEVHPDDLTTID